VRGIYVALGAVSRWLKSCGGEGLALLAGKAERRRTAYLGDFRVLDASVCWTLPSLSVAASLRSLCRPSEAVEHIWSDAGQLALAACFCSQTCSEGVRLNVVHGGHTSMVNLRLPAIHSDIQLHVYIHIHNPGRQSAAELHVRPTFRHGFLS
jgi:hypothetical protein